MFNIIVVFLNKFRQICEKMKSSLKGQRLQIECNILIDMCDQMWEEVSNNVDFDADWDEVKERMKIMQKQALLFDILHYRKIFLYPEDYDLRFLKAMKEAVHHTRKHMNPEDLYEMNGKYVTAKEFLGRNPESSEEIRDINKKFDDLLNCA